MHQQQAQAKMQAQQQRQQQLAQQQQKKLSAQQQQSRTNTRGRGSSTHITKTAEEETISRIMHKIRQDGQNSSLSSQSEGSNQSLLPHIVRMKKDEEDMDEDERLLASEEGKKLTSKERRQLRNKVSARAFRSRRKGEFISIFI
jgi:HD-GYP domain-containing protein (c-di-GMP phosphodiesterase class II)